MALALLFVLAAGFVHSFYPGGELWGCVAGIGVALTSVIVSYFQLHRSLNAPGNRFMAAFVIGMAVRVVIVGAGSLAVWRLTDWDLKKYLVLLGLSYPLLLAIESFFLWRELGEKAGDKAVSAHGSQGV